MLAGCVRSFPDGGILTSCRVRSRSTLRYAARSAFSLLAPCSGNHVSARAVVPGSRSRGAKSSFVSCNVFAGRSGCGESEEEDGDYLEASLLLEETVSHYRMRKWSPNDVKWQTSSQSYPFTLDRPGIDQRTLSRFRSPMIFLKITFDGDYLLPISVGEYALEKLIEAIQQGETEECQIIFSLSEISQRIGCNERICLSFRVAVFQY